MVVLCGEALVKLSFPIAENGVLVKHCELLFRSGASLLSTTDCLSPKQRRWPEDLAWHPQGDSLVSVYSADGGDSQISVMDLNKRQEEQEGVHRSIMLDSSTSKCRQITLIHEGQGLSQRSLSPP
ncbi:hypothetical protein L1049_019922 [Liquidambar formosana]|uniref:Uncharacterized protein n=1 Tax=Liquidambar formosana TaxID=63359 RepID=A0AAP0XAF6_LIQFO